MKNDFNILRLCCLLQDRDSQDLKRVVLSIIFEIQFESNNSEISVDELYIQTNAKFNTALDRDFFDSLILKSDSFETTNTNESPLLKLTSAKFNEIDRDISEFSIEPHIEKFLVEKGLDANRKDKLVELLFQSIYENIYTFTPEKIQTLIPQGLIETAEQQDLDAFNAFLEYDNNAKNRCLYNQFAKAIEFAILTSGKGVNQFSDNLYKDKCYLLDTNIIFRLIGVGGEERQSTMIQLLKDCIKQGITFEFSNQTLMELNKRLEQCVIDLQRAEKARKIEIVANVLAQIPSSFNDDFITQYCKMRSVGEVSSPEQYELQMKTRFKALCEELSIGRANHGIKVEDYEVNLFSLHLKQRRSEINSYYKYSNKQAKVDAFNTLYVRKRRGGNNYNYADVKSFYLTTDRGLNRILAQEQNSLVPETILPSQLFIIHNPLSNGNTEEVDYQTFFRFLKKRTSQFKMRGKDVINYINQARTFTTDPKEITAVVQTYSDQRYEFSRTESLDEHSFISFKDFSQTYFDAKNAEFEEVNSSYSGIVSIAETNLKQLVLDSKMRTRMLDIGLYSLILPGIALLIKFVAGIDWTVFGGLLVISELIKFITSSRSTFLKKVWLSIFNRMVKRSPYYKMTQDSKYLQRGIDEIHQLSDNIWK